MSKSQRSKFLFILSREPQTSRNSKQNSIVRNLFKAGTVLQLICSALGRKALTQIGELLKIPMQAEGLASMALLAISSS